MYELHIPEGRLVLLDIATPVASQEVERLGSELKAAMTRVGGAAIVCVNFTEAELLPPHVSQGYLRIMRNDNPHLIRSAFLVSDTGMFGQQLERMIAEADNPKRSLFRNRDELELWLSQVATPGEQAALRSYLHRRLAGGHAANG